jgi:hypothetical protein
MVNWFNVLAAALSQFPDREATNQGGGNGLKTVMGDR